MTPPDELAPDSASLDDPLLFIVLAVKGLLLESTERSLYISQVATLSGEGGSVIFREV